MTDAQPTVPADPLDALVERQSLWAGKLFDVLNGYVKLDSALLAATLQDFQWLLAEVRRLRVALDSAEGDLKGATAVADAVAAMVLESWDAWHKDGFTSQPPDDLLEALALLRPAPPPVQPAPLPGPVEVAW